MVTDERWYKDTGALLDELRQTQQGDARPAIEGYDLLREIARGGQGVVFEAIHLSTKRRVAIKVLLEGIFTSDAGRIRFEREIDLAAGLRHANVVQVYDRGVTADGRLYFVMEYIEGRSLDQFITDERTNSGGILKTPAMLKLMVKICEAVNYAHQRGVIHRDLKPSNIRIDDAEGQPHVLDFGLAKLHHDFRDEDSDTPEVSISGQFLGSLPWASPEQAEGSHDLMDIRSDVYSLGVMLYQIFTDRFPYPVTGPLREVLDNIVNAEPPRLSSFNRSVDDELETIVLKCLAKEPRRRYQSAGDLSRDLGHYLNGEPIEAKRNSTWYTIRKTMTRHKFAVGSAASFLVFLVAFAVTMTLLMNRAVSAEDLARHRLVDLEAENLRAMEAEALAQKRTEELEAEAEKVEYVNEFMLTAMVFSNSDRSKLSQLTVRELLDNAIAQIATTPWLEGKPEVVAEVHNNFSYWLGGCERFEEAVHHQLEALRLRTEVYGEMDVRLHENYRSLGYGYDLLGNPDKAFEYGRKAIALLEAQEDVNHDWLTQSMIDLGLSQLKYDRLDEAQETIERVREITETHLDPDAWQPIVIHRLNGMLLTRLKRFEEAEPELLMSYGQSLVEWGPDHPQIVYEKAELVTLYEAWGKPDEADKYRPE